MLEEGEGSVVRGHERVWEGARAGGASARGGECGGEREVSKMRADCCPLGVTSKNLSETPRTEGSVVTARRRGRRGGARVQRCGVERL